LFLIRRIRSRKAKAKEDREIRAVINVFPEPWAKRLSQTLEDHQWKQWAALGFGVWFLLRVAEIRQLRRTNKLLVVRAA
jgi:hypothetical protein